jgi:programmed cell death 6-interacting protein
MDILDQEATENETLLERQPYLGQSRPASHVANQQLIATAGQYEATIKQAANSDQSVKEKARSWSKKIKILEGGEVRPRRFRADNQDTMSEYVPSTSTSASGTLAPPSVRPLRASLEELDDRIVHRANLVNEARAMAEKDDIRPEVIKEASRLAHGGSGDVQTEWFEEMFERALGKYEGLKKEITAEMASQETLLEAIRVSEAGLGCLLRSPLLLILPRYSVPHRVSR